MDTYIFSGVYKPPFGWCWYRQYNNLCSCADLLPFELNYMVSTSSGQSVLRDLEPSSVRPWRTHRVCLPSRCRCGENGPNKKTSPTQTRTPWEEDGCFLGTWDRSSLGWRERKLRWAVIPAQDFGSFCIFGRVASNIQCHFFAFQPSRPLRAAIVPVRYPGAWGFSRVLFFVGVQPARESRCCAGRKLTDSTCTSLENHPWFIVTWGNGAQFDHIQLPNGR